MANDFLQRMLDGAPDYYGTSKVYQDVQDVIAIELQTVQDNNNDLRLQFAATTATWGLEHFEKELAVPVVPTDSYEIRRSRVTAKERGPGKFSAALVKSVCESFSGGDVQVTYDVPTLTMQVKFTGSRGIPVNLSDLEDALDNLIHAHVALAYSYTFFRFVELDAKGWNWTAVNTGAYTWATFETLS